MSSSTTDAAQCVSVGRCKCEMSDGSGIVSLEGIHQNSDGTPRFTVEDGTYNWNYAYNPCKAFNSDLLTDLAVYQYSYYTNSGGYDVGAQSYEYFNLTDTSGLYLHYTATDGVRMSRVNLLCNRELSLHLFYLIGELSIAEYDFILEGPCACPGGCDENGIITRDPDAGNSGGDSLKWSTVSYDLVSLFLHDLILVVIIGAVLLVLKFFFNCSCGDKSGGGGGGLPNINFSSNP